MIDYRRLWQTGQNQCGILSNVFARLEAATTLNKFGDKNLLSWRLIYN